MIASGCSQIAAQKQSREVSVDEAMKTMAQRLDNVDSQLAKLTVDATADARCAGLRSYRGVM